MRKRIQNSKRASRHVEFIETWRRLTPSFDKLRMTAIWTLLFAFYGTFSSCLKDDVPVKLPDPGNVETKQIPMGQDYSKQFFFDLGTNQIVSENDKMAWDLAFENGSEGYRVTLNTAKFMFAGNTLSADFNAVTNADGVMWKWDLASGNLDSTAIGEWGTHADGRVVSNNHVYLINRGRGTTGSSIGNKKVVFEKMESGIYYIHFANLDGSEDHTFEVKKNDSHTFTYFSFDDGGKEMNIAPEKNSWDIQFTQYTHFFSETPDNIPQPDTITPYPVTGVLQNPNGVTVAEDFVTAFSAIDLSDTYSYEFSSDLDIIGYDWKVYNGTAGFYSMVPGKNYIIKDTEGYFYKLRFIDFYSTEGERGFPKFEFQRL